MLMELPYPEIGVEIAPSLDKVADYIEHHGWRQGENDPQPGRVVLLGAIGYACTSDEEAATVRVYLEEELEHDLDDWNDAVGRTKEDVVAMLRSEANRLRVKHS